MLSLVRLIGNIPKTLIIFSFTQIFKYKRGFQNLRERKGGIEIELVKLKAFLKTLVKGLPYPEIG